MERAAEEEVPVRPSWTVLTAKWLFFGCLGIMAASSFAVAVLSVSSAAAKGGKLNQHESVQIIYSGLLVSSILTFMAALLGMTAAGKESRRGLYSYGILITWVLLSLLAVYLMLLGYRHHPSLSERVRLHMKELASVQLDPTSEDVVTKGIDQSMGRWMQSRECCHFNSDPDGPESYTRNIVYWASTKGFGSNLAKELQTVASEKKRTALVPVGCCKHWKNRICNKVPHSGSLHSYAKLLIMLNRNAKEAGPIPKQLERALATSGLDINLKSCDSPLNGDEWGLIFAMMLAVMTPWILLAVWSFLLAKRIEGDDYDDDDDDED